MTTQDNPVSIPSQLGSLLLASIECWDTPEFLVSIPSQLGSLLLAANIEISAGDGTVSIPSQLGSLLLVWSSMFQAVRLSSQYPRSWAASC